MKKRDFCIAGICGLLFLILIVLLKTVDVAPAGAAGSDIGLSTLNCAFHDLTGVHVSWYKITLALGAMSIASVGVFGIIGLVQWIQRKELLKVDREILAMGIMFLVLLGIYIFFQNVVVNYRPVLMPGNTEPEPSFPSSHTMMTIVVLISVMMIIDKYLKSPVWCKVIKILAVLDLIAMILGRTLCGVHWLTDIIGGVLLSITLLALFHAGKQQN